MPDKPDKYKTIQSSAEGIFKDRGSKFLSYAYPVTGEGQVKEIINDLKKKYHDARHHCYAYRIGAEEPYNYRLNDDGEPSGTAGKPIYGQILSYGLTNILIVVVRYFGGTLLGTSGLIQAYKGATINCLEQCTTIEKTIYSKLRISFPYSQMNNIMRIIKEGSIKIISQQSELECSMDLGIRKSQFDKVISRMERIEDIQMTS